MTSPSASKIDVASISDRGLSEKRPLNEDSFLADSGRGIFVVADGVGGADAGEIASKTAVDVLDDAFRAKITDGEDVEDLMELAIPACIASRPTETSIAKLKIIQSSKKKSGRDV